MSDGPSKRPRDDDDSPTKHDTDPLTRPARLQTKPHDRILRAREALQTDPTYNIWYNRKSESWEDKMNAGPKEVSSVRCIPSLDEGVTKANAESYICLHFARGECHEGPNCKYFHRVPDEDFSSRLDSGRDCFGRERFATDRDDMGGVGNFMRDGRTLYVGGLKTSISEPLEEVLEKHFSDFGELERINVVYGKGNAYITFRLRPCAEFAKVAMANQSLGHGEVLNVRWAEDDVNPKALEEEHARKLREAAVAIAKARKKVVDQMTITPGYDSSSAQYYQQYTSSAEMVAAPAYPDTTPQYAVAAAAADEAAKAAGVDDQYVHAVADGGEQEQTQEWSEDDWKRYRAWYEYYYGVPPPDTTGAQPLVPYADEESDDEKETKKQKS